jgi:hypothetical protein
MKLIRDYIRALLEQKNQDKIDSPDDLLGEPDDPGLDSEQEEASMAGAVAGVTVPLGAGPTYPNKPRKKRKSPASSAGKSFGNAKPIKK